MPGVPSKRASKLKLRATIHAVSLTNRTKRRLPDGSQRNAVAHGAHLEHEADASLGVFHRINTAVSSRALATSRSLPSKKKTPMMANIRLITNMSMSTEKRYVRSGTSTKMMRRDST